MDRIDSLVEGGVRTLEGSPEVSLACDKACGIISSIFRSIE